MPLYIIKCRHHLMGKTSYIANDKVEALRKADKLKKEGWKVEVERYATQEQAKGPDRISPGQKGLPPS
jgi:hypothetical protein